MQFEITQWIEDLISLRDSYRHECEKVGHENYRLKERLAAKDAEIAELKAGILNNWGKTIHNATPQPAQGQADEHPVKKGWLQLNDRTITAWSPDEAGVKHKTHGRTWAMQYLAVYPDRLPEAIAAYDRYMEGGQAQ